VVEDDADIFPVALERESLGVRGPETRSVGGIIVTFHDYYTPAGRHEPHWVMGCAAHRNGQCSKRKGALPKNERRHGVIEPLAFLHAWHEVAGPTKPTIKSHALETPTPAAVDAFAMAHREELLDVVRRAKS